MGKRKRLTDDQGRSLVLKALTKGSRLAPITTYDPYVARTLDPKKVRAAEARAARTDR